MHALAFERVQIDGGRRDERLAFARLHLRDLAFVEDHAAHELHVEMALAERALGGFADGGEGFDEEAVELLALGEAFLEFGGLGAQGVVGELHELRFERVDGADAIHLLLDEAFVRIAEKPLRPRAQASHMRDSLSGVVSGLKPPPVRVLSRMMTPARPSRAENSHAPLNALACRPAHGCAEPVRKGPPQIGTRAREVNAPSRRVKCWEGFIFSRYNEVRDFAISLRGRGLAILCALSVLAIIRALQRSLYGASFPAAP